MPDDNSENLIVSRLNYSPSDILKHGNYDDCSLHITHYFNDITEFIPIRLSSVKCMKQALKTPKCSPICGLGWQNTRETKFVAASRLVDIAPHRHWDKKLDPPLLSSDKYANTLMLSFCVWSSFLVTARYSERSLFQRFSYCDDPLFRRFVIPKVRYFAGSLFRRFVIPEVRYSENEVRFVIPKVR